MKHTPLHACWIGVLVMLAAQTVPATDLVTLQAHYQKGLARIADGYEARQKALHEAYLKGIGNAEGAAQKKGDLNGVLAARQEKERFAKAKDVPDANTTNIPPAIAEIQARYREVALAMVIDKEKQILDLADRYGAVLTALEQDLTKQNKIDDAVAVQNERQRVMQRPEVTAAQFSLADAQAAVQSAMSAGPPKSSVN